MEIQNFPSQAKIRKLLFLTLFPHLLFSGINAQVTNSSYVTQYQEKVLQLSIIIPVDKKDAWNLFTTDQGLIKWVAPVAVIDMRTGGYIKTNYDKDKRVDDSSSIILGLINYLEYEMITLKVNLNNSFPADVKAGDKNLQEIIQFFDAGKGRTKIISSMVGWGQGKNWDSAYAFFEKGNEWTYKQVLKIFEK
jgi:hypothetical protein